jgi:sugar/nucleoside kinase (ribokinase family)
MVEYVAFGIVIDDIALPDGTAHPGLLGGGGPQTAWGMAAALGEGSRGESVGLCAEVGADFDPASLAPVRALGVDTAGVRAGGGLTPRAWQRIDAEGNREHVWRVPPRGSITFGKPIDAILPPAYQAARGFHWGLHPESPSLENARLLLSRERRVCLETFKPPDAPLSEAELGALVSSCTIFSPNWREAVGITGTDDHAQIIARFRAAGCTILALRRGAQGAEVWDFAQGRGVRAPAVPVTVVDTVGAGNAFCGALLAAYETQGIERAACHAVAAASYLVEQYGLPPAPPNPGEYRRRFDYAWARLERLST